jgi:hypothetical protein
MESSSSSSRPTVRRSKAWIYYAVLAAIALVAIPSVGWQTLPAVALFGLYSAYLFRGGRIVIWFW